MIIHRLTEAEFDDKRWPQYYVAPTCDFTSDDFVADYDRSTRGLDSALSKFGKGMFGDGLEEDFGIQLDCHSTHRSLGMCLYTKKMLCPEVIPTIQEFLQSLPYPYIVCIDCEDEIEGYFSCVVEVDTLWIHVGRPEVEESLGIQ